MRQTTHPTEPRDLVLALFTVAMVGASVVIVGIGTLIPFFETAFHLPKATLGLILTVLMLGPMLFTATAGLLVDRFGDKAIVFVTGWIMGVALVIASLHQQFLWLLLWLFVYGAGYAGVTPAGSHAILFFFDRRSRGVAMGIRQMGVPLGGLVGAVLLPSVAIRYGYGAALVAGAIVCIATSMVAALCYREPVALRGEHASLRSLIAGMLHIGFEPALLLVVGVSVTLMAVQIALMGFLPLTYKNLGGYTHFIAAAVFGVSQIAAMGGRMTWGWISDRRFGGNRMLPLAIISVCSAVAAIGVGSLHAIDFALAVLAAALLGFAGEGWFGLTAIALAEIGGEEHAGSALGFGMTLIFIAAMIAAPVFGAVIDRFGYQAAWYALAAVALIGLVPALGAHATLQKRAPAGR